MYTYMYGHISLPGYKAVDHNGVCWWWICSGFGMWSVMHAWILNNTQQSFSIPWSTVIVCDVWANYYCGSSVKDFVVSGLFENKLTLVWLAPFSTWFSTQWLPTVCTAHTYCGNHDMSQLSVQLCDSGSVHIIRNNIMMFITPWDD